MREKTLRKIDSDTFGLPGRWREVLYQALLDGEFETEAERLLESALTAHTDPPGGMERAESILAGDAFIPMAVEILADSGVPLESIDAVLQKAIQKLMAT